MRALRGVHPPLTSRSLTGTTFSPPISPVSFVSASARPAPCSRRVQARLLTSRLCSAFKAASRSPHTQQPKVVSLNSPRRWPTSGRRAASKSTPSPPDTWLRTSRRLCRMTPHAPDRSLNVYRLRDGVRLKMSLGLPSSLPLPPATTSADTFSLLTAAGSPASWGMALQFKLAGRRTCVFRMDEQYILQTLHQKGTQ